MSNGVIYQVFWYQFSHDTCPDAGLIFSTRELAEAYVARYQRFQPTRIHFDIEEWLVDECLGWQQLPDDRCAYFVWFDMNEGTATAHSSPTATKLDGIRGEEIWDEIEQRGKIRVDVWASSENDAIEKATAKRDAYLAGKDAA